MHRIIAVSLLLPLLSTAYAGRQSDAEDARDPRYAPPAEVYTVPPPAAGAIYNPASGFGLFMDLRARAVGDILQVLLVERTDASKESSTATGKTGKVAADAGTIAGRTITYKGQPLLSNELSGDRSFDGKSDSSQSNKLQGSITVTVAERLPNGNLLVRGEKRITINQGQEFIRLQGIVRPVDIGPANTVPSTKIADATITYTGKGTLANSNRQGWLSRFFNSPWFPF
ncbi:MAG TPA: flagellar basal body L-ring protein FlgH [Gammaproteobacteria bacterium]|nr:flagellar basal body L-ring protein FlgH [Gammaproteobacteria bacterium]